MCEDEKRYNNAEFGAKLRAWRIANALTQGEVALQLQLAGLDCDQVRISRIEKGKVRMSIFEFEVLRVCYGLKFEKMMN